MTPREQLKMMYPSYQWRNKVSKMTDAQVTAIYLRMKKEGKIK